MLECGEREDFAAVVCELGARAAAAKAGAALEAAYPPDVAALRSDIAAAGARLDALRAALTAEAQSLRSAISRASAIVGTRPSVRFAPASSPQIVVSEAHIAPVSADELATAPSWRGRLPLARLNAWIEAFNALLDERAAVLRGRTATVEARQRAADVRAAECDETCGRPFLTENDLRWGRVVGVARTGGSPAAVFRMDQTGRTIIAVLRHLGRIREVRSAGLLRYVVC